MTIPDLFQLIIENIRSAADDPGVIPQTTAADTRSVLDQIVGYLRDLPGTKSPFFVIQQNSENQDQSAQRTIIGFGTNGGRVAAIAFYWQNENGQAFNRWEYTESFDTAAPSDAIWLPLLPALETKGLIARVLRGGEIVAAFYDPAVAVDYAGNDQIQNGDVLEFYGVESFNWLSTGKSNLTARSFNPLFDGTTDIDGSGLLTFEGYWGPMNHDGTHTQIRLIEFTQRSPTTPTQLWTWNAGDVDIYCNGARFFSPNGVPIFSDKTVVTYGPKGVAWNTIDYDLNPLPADIVTQPADGLPYQLPAGYQVRPLHIQLPLGDGGSLDINLSNSDDSSYYEFLPHPSDTFVDPCLVNRLFGRSSNRPIIVDVPAGFPLFVTGMAFNDIDNSGYILTPRSGPQTLETLGHFTRITFAPIVITNNNGTFYCNLVTSFASYY